ncbi:MAG: hypothetical protein PXZ07_05375 [Candidatus Eremiobacteraeota bacterium]|nr:hypothetical protein [Candidatus Eremiobacteraeota bacterium]
MTDYDVADLAGASRDTISRWRRRPVALSAKTIDRLMASLDEEAEATSAAYVELKHALTTAKQALTAAESAPAERLRRRLNERGYRGNAVLAEIHAAGLQVTGKDGS